MRKAVYMCMIAFVIGIFIGLLSPIKEKTIHEFEIFQSYSFGNVDYRDTTLQVIVYSKEYDIDELYEKVRVFHNKMNGIPDKLTINIYNSKEDWEISNSVGTRIFYKGT